MDLGAFNEVLRLHPDLLAQDITSNYVVFIRSFLRAFFHNGEMLSCNVDGTNGLQPLCPARLGMLLQYAKHYFPVTYAKSERRMGGVPHSTRLINTVLRQRRNDFNKKGKI